MKAKFTRAEGNRLGLRFEPESFEEQLLLEQFVRDSTAIGHRFEFSSFEHNAPGRATREGMTSCWGQLVARQVQNEADDECSCGVHTTAQHPEARNLLEGSAERDGRVCKLGWPL